MSFRVSADIFKKKDDRSGDRLIDMIRDAAKQKGTGKWTSQDAMELQVPTPTIDTAVAMRDLSGYKSERTKELASQLKSLGLDDVLIVVSELEDNLALASRNLHKVGLCTTAEINPVALIGCEKVLMTADAVKQIEGMFA